jgi:hypothetical protein
MRLSWTTISSVSLLGTLCFLAIAIYIQNWTRGHNLSYQAPFYRIDDPECGVWGYLVELRAGHSIEAHDIALKGLIDPFTKRHMTNQNSDKSKETIYTAMTDEAGLAIIRSDPGVLAVSCNVQRQGVEPEFGYPGRVSQKPLAHSE